MRKEVARMAIEIGYDEDGVIYLIADNYAQIKLIEGYVAQIKTAIEQPYVLAKGETEVKVSGI